MRKCKKLLFRFGERRFDSPGVFYSRTIYYRLRLKNKKHFDGYEFHHRVMRCYVANYGRVYCKSVQLQLELNFD